MPASLTLDSVCLRDPEGTPLFSDLSFSLSTDRIGLVGRNGSGKSTLLSLIANGGAPPEGTIVRHGRIGMLAQDWPEHATIGEALGVNAALDVIARVLDGTATGSDLDRADWTLEARIQSALASAGLPADLALDRTISTLSGGERTRVGIARLLIEEQDVLLLDEPTNNLDSDGRASIARLLDNWGGGALVASHDRTLLERMDRIVELSPVGVRIVGGGWTTFETQREAERDLAADALERTQSAARDARRTAQHEREARARRDKAGRTFAAKASEPRILLGRQAERAQNSAGRGEKVADRLVRDADEAARVARARVEVIAPLTIELPPCTLPRDSLVLALDAVEVCHGQRRFGPWSLDLRGPARIAVTGVNGAGKSTFLRVAAGLLDADRGIVQRRGRHALLDQHLGLLDHTATILENVMRATGLDRQQAQAICARFAFRNRDAEQGVASLSGGERMRAALACTLGHRDVPCLLMLDEPTNHLDLETINVLESALAGWNGALMVVSHDAAFLAALGIEQVFHVEPGNAR